MSRRGARRFPPRRLTAIPDHSRKWLRPLWWLALALAILLDIAGAAFIVRDLYVNDPEFAAVGLASQIEDDGSVTVSSMVAGPDGTLAIADDSRIVAIDGKPVARALRVGDLAQQIRAASGPTVSLAIRNPEGGIALHRVARHVGPIEASGRSYLSRDTRNGLRLAISLLSCAVLIGCACLLFARRPRDPVALLLSFSFLLFAGSIDPPLNMWLAYGAGELFDVYSVLAWMLLVIGLAVFPDGKFEPSWLRWLIIAVPLGSPLLAIDSIPLMAQAVLAFVLPLVLVASQVAKYRRFGEGIERQQIKWAAFGFAAGLVLVTLAFAMVAAFPEGQPPSPEYGLVVLFFFNGGFMVMALGLLISLIRFRLWEADKVISRSAIYALVTLAVGMFWAASTDLVKVAVEFVLGAENRPVATAAGAMLAAGIFAPTQSLALRWTRKRFDKDSERIRRLVSRLAVWRATEAPDEIGQRTLSALSAATHASAAAILVDTPLGREIIAARDVEKPEDLAEPGARLTDDPRFPLSLPLEDEDGPVGVLLVGPRSDNNRYNRDERAGFEAVLEPLAEALRAALKRAHQASSMQTMISSVEERLAQLEQGAKLSPS
jgi:hypothetical protein